MKQVTFDGATTYLIATHPDWGSPVQVTAEVPTHVESGLAGHETRRPLGDTLRLRIGYRGILIGNELLEWRNALLALTTQKVLCPLWPAGFAAGTTPPLTSAYYVLLDDTAVPEIKQDADRPFSRMAYPLMVGRLGRDMDPALLDDENATLDVEFIEDSVYPITPPAFTPPTGCSTRPLFPWRGNWATPPSSGGATVQLERREIGQGRELATAHFDAPPRRQVRFHCTLTENEPWQLLRFFLDQSNADTFWLPAGLSEARLTADVDGGDPYLLCDRPNGPPYALLDDLVNRAPLIVTDSSTTLWILSDVVGQAFVAANTRIESVILARFNSPRLSLYFNSPLIARIDFHAVEVPLEDTQPEGEELGVTLGAVPTLAYLYTFSIAFPSVTQTWRYTSFERDLACDPDTFSKASIEHDSIRSTATLERQEVSFKSRHFPQNPLGLLIPFQLEWPLMVEIAECEVSGNNAVNVSTLFHGEIVSGTFDGPFIRATARSLPGLFTRSIPRRLLQPACNWTLFESPRCGLDKSYWKWQGNIGTGGYNPSTLALTLITVSPVSPNPGHSITDHYLAGGWVEVGSATNVQFRLIADNTAQSGSTIAMRLATPFTVAPADGALVCFFPGCDGRVATCHDKFSNRPNFGGFPFMPIGNPSLLRISKNASAGAKK